MFRIAQRQLMWLLISPKFYVALLTGSVRYIFNTIKLAELSLYLDEPLQFLDSFTYSLSDPWAMVLIFFSLLFLLSEMPYSEGDQSYELLRITKKKWLAGKLLYIALVTVAYYLALLLIGLLVIGKQSYLANIWSDPMYQLCRSSILGESFGNLYFGNSSLMVSFEPIGAALCSLVLAILFSVAMLSLLMLINMRFPRGIGIGILIFIIAVSYLLGVYIKQHLQFSLLIHSVLLYHTIDTPYRAGQYPLLSHSVMVFSGLIAIHAFLLSLTIKRYDFKSLSGNAV